MKKGIENLQKSSTPLYLYRTAEFPSSGEYGLVSGIASGTTTLYALGSGAVYSSSYCAYDPHCPYNSSFQGSGPGNICDFRVTPATVYAQSCSGTKNSNNFGTTITPSVNACPVDQVQSSCTARRGSGAIELDVGTPTCAFPGAPASPSMNVQYFAGPGTSGQSVGTLVPEFTLVFHNTAVTESATANVICP
jgi:hypothetical protein